MNKRNNLSSKVQNTPPQKARSEHLSEQTITTIRKLFIISIPFAGIGAFAMSYAAAVSISVVSIAIAYLSYLLAVFSLAYAFFALFRHPIPHKPARVAQGIISAILYLLPFLLFSYRVINTSHYALIAFLIVALILPQYMYILCHKTDHPQSLKHSRMAFVGFALAASCLSAYITNVMTKSIDASFGPATSINIALNIIYVLGLFLTIPINLISLVQLPYRYPRSYLFIFPGAMLILIILQFLLPVGL